VSRRAYFPSFVWNSIAKLGDFGFAYVFSVLLARMLAPEGYGTFASIMSVCTFVIVLASTGIDNTLHRFLGEASAHPDTGPRVSLLLRALGRARLALTACLVLAVFLGRGWIAARFQNPAMAGLVTSSLVYLAAQSLALFGANALVGLLRTRAVAAFTTCFRLANIGLAVVMVRGGAGVPEIMLMLGGTSVALAVAYAVVVVPLARGGLSTADLSPAFSFARTSWVLAVVSFGLGRQTDVILLNVLRHSQTEVALYDIAYSLAQTVPMVLTIGLTGIALTLFSKRYASRPDGLASIWRSFIVIVGGVTVPLFVFMIVNADACVSIMYGTQYSGGGRLLVAYALPTVIYWALGGGASSTALHASNRVKTVLAIRTVVGVLNVVVNVFLIRAWGAWGALVGTGVCGAAAGLAELVAVATTARAAPAVRHVPGLLAATAVGLAPSVLARPEGLAALAAHGALFVVLFLATLRILRPLPELDEGLAAALPARIASLLSLFTARTARRREPPRDPRQHSS